MDEDEFEALMDALDEDRMERVFEWSEGSCDLENPESCESCQ